jgi:hypothetical protein
MERGMLMRRRLSSILLVTIVLVLPAAPSALAWSEPVYTQPWTEAEYTDPWAEVEYTDPWAEAEYTDPWAEVEYTEVLGTGTPTDQVGEIDDFLLDFESLYGVWRVFLESQPLGEGKVQPGMDQGVLNIRSDGTYTMTHVAWSREPVNGTWRLSYPREINGEVVQAIVLLDGPGGSDWAVAPDPKGTIRLLWAMRWSDGSALWIFDSELYRP